MSQNLSSAAVVIGALRVKPCHAESDFFYLIKCVDANQPKPTDKDPHCFLFIF